jgi:hypothetical protein
VSKVGQIGVRDLKQFVGLHGQLRNLPRPGQLRAATPVTVAAKSIDIRQYPAGYDEIRMFSGLTQQIQADRYIFQLQPHQQFFRKLDVLWVWGCILVAGYGLDKRWRDR